MQIANALNMKRPNVSSILVALDLSKAFDMVLHDKLLDDVFNSTLPNQLKRCILVYLTGRQSYVEFRVAKSKRRIAKQGVAQGGVLAPIFFKLYVSKILQTADSVKLVTYADDYF